MPWFAQEYAGALNVMGVGAPVMIDTPGDLDPALGSDEVDRPLLARVPVGTAC